MTRLKSKLLSFNAHKTVPTKIYSPANCEELRIPFKTDKVAKVVGRLAQIAPPLPRTLNADGEEAEAVYEEDKVEMISGVLIQNDFKISLMAPEDLKEYAGLTTTTVLCRQHLTLSAAGIDLIRWALEGTFGAITASKTTDTNIDGKETKMNGNGIHDAADEEISRTETTFTVMDCVNVLVKTSGRVEVSWEGNVINDGIADAVLAVLFTVESSPAAVKRTSSHLQTCIAYANSSSQSLQNPTPTPTPTPPQKKSTPHNSHTTSNPHTPTAPQTQQPASPASSFSSKHNSVKTPCLRSSYRATLHLRHRLLQIRTPSPQRPSWRPSCRPKTRRN
jgi:cleavage and polyadenylation specificity factor subunit 3